MRQFSAPELVELLRRADRSLAEVSGIYEAPRDWEERRELLAISELTKLAVFVPERYDLAIMKLARGATHDLDAVEGLHAKAPLELRVLVERYRTTDVLGDGLDFKLALVGLGERLWGEDEADRLLVELDNA